MYNEMNFTVAPTNIEISSYYELLNAFKHGYIIKYGDLVYKCINKKLYFNFYGFGGNFHRYSIFSNGFDRLWKNISKFGRLEKFNDKGEIVKRGYSIKVYIEIDVNDEYWYTKIPHCGILCNVKNDLKMKSNIRMIRQHNDKGFTFDNCEYWKYAEPILCKFTTIGEDLLGL